jgi:glutaminyl-tRNA synthetase
LNLFYRLIGPLSQGLRNIQVIDFAKSSVKMADAVTEAMAQLVLDEATGEMVSKGELKKRIQKRAKKAAREKQRESTKDQAAPAAKKPPSEHNQIDPDSMFKQGFLAAVYKERPIAPITRFPPEPNGYLHLGHAKAIAVNFGFGRHYGGKTLLRYCLAISPQRFDKMATEITRYDDTNPEAEETKYVVSIEEIIRWLGMNTKWNPTISTLHA